MDSDLKAIVFLATICFTIGAVSAVSYKVDKRTQWEEGDFENTTFDREGLILESDGVQLDWANTSYDNRIEDVEKQNEYSDYVFAAGEDNNGDQSVWKYDEDGNLDWKYDRSFGKIWSLAVGEDYVYAGSSRDIVVKIDKSDGGEEDIFNTPNNDVRGIELKNGFLFVGERSGVSGNSVTKIDPDVSGGNVEWSTNINDYFSSYVGTYELTVTNSGQVFAGGNSLVKLDSDGSYIKKVSSPGGRYHGVEIGNDGYLYAGGGYGFSGNDGYIQKYDLSLNNDLWTYYTDARVFDIDLDLGNNIYASTTFNDDRTYKLNKSGGLKWVIKDPESQLGVESHSNGAYSGGSRTNSGDGVLSRFIETYVDKGEYKSEIFSSGAQSSWNNMRVNSTLKGQSANITFQSSNNGFSTIENSKEIELSGGIETFGINTNAEDARFQIDIEGSNTKTPVIDAVTLNEQVNSGLKCNEFGLIGCWKMEAGQGQIVYDYSDKHNDGAMGYLFSPDSEDPGWINDSSKCVSGGCLNNSEPDYAGQVSISDSENLTFEKFSLTGAIKLDISDGSPGTIIHKENEFKVVADYPSGSIAASLYNTTECGGWCGNDPVLYGGNHFYYSDMQANYGEWFTFKVTWNGTHFSFYNKTGLIDQGSPSKVDSYTSPEDNSADLLIGAKGRNQGSHLEGPIDEIKLFNSSELGFVPGTVVCNPSQGGSYTNIDESTEDEGRLKNDREVCLETPSGNYEFYDQDYGDIDGDGVQETCRDNNLYGQRGIRWISESMVEDHPNAFTGGIDDDKIRLTSENFESLPDQNSWNFNFETPVPTGASEDYAITLGFCGGDDEGEYLVTQECNTGLCSTDNSVIGVAKTPKSCVLNGQDYNLKDSDNKQRKLYSQGENITFDLGSSSESVACFNGVWYDKWPVSAGPTEKMEVGNGQTSSFNFKVINIQDVRKEFKVELQGDEEVKRYTEFERREGDSFEISVPPKSSKNIRINVFGGNSNLDDAEVRVQATALTGDISGEDSFKVDILDSKVGSSGPAEPQNVPGVSLIHLIVLLLIAGFIRFKTI